MFSIFLLLFCILKFSHAQSQVLGYTTLECRYACDDPTCPPVCYTKCAPPVCQIDCTPHTTICPFVPQCSVRCAANVSVADFCPMCETICQPPHPVMCAGCSPLCEATACGWVCEKPTNCPLPRCELVCERPSCEYSLASRVVVMMTFVIFLVMII